MSTGDDGGTGPDGDDALGAWVTIRAALNEVYDRPCTLDRSFEMVTPLIPGSVADQLIVPTHDLAPCSMSGAQMDARLGRW